MLFMNNFGLFSVIDCFVYRFLKTQGWFGFLAAFPPVDVFLIVVSMGKICNTRKNNVSFKEKYSIVNKAKPPPIFSCCCRCVCEQHGAKVLRFLSQLHPRIPPSGLECILSRRWKKLEETHAFLLSRRGKKLEETYTFLLSSYFGFSPRAPPPHPEQL